MAHVSLTGEDGNGGQYKRVGYQNTTHNVNTSPNRNKKEENMHHYTHSINIPQSVIKTHQYKTQNKFELLPNKVAVSPLHCYYSKFEYKSGHGSRQRHKSHKMPKVNRNINEKGGGNNDEVEKESNIELKLINNEEEDINNGEKDVKEEVLQIKETQLILINEETRHGSNVQSEEKSILPNNNKDEDCHRKVQNDLQVNVINDRKNNITENIEKKQMEIKQIVNISSDIKLIGQSKEFNVNQFNEVIGSNSQSNTEKPLKAVNNYNHPNKDNANLIKDQDNQLSQSFSQKHNQTNQLDESLNTMSNQTETSLNREMRRPLEIVKRTISLRKSNKVNIQQTPDTINQTAKQLHYATLGEQRHIQTEANNNADYHHQQNKPSLLIDISQEVQIPIQTEPVIDVVTNNINNTIVYKRKKSMKDTKTHIRQHIIEKECISNCIDDNDNRVKCLSRNNYSSKETETKMDTIKDVKPATETYESKYKDTDIMNSNNHQWLTRHTLINTESFQLNAQINNNDYIDNNNNIINNTKENNMEGEVKYQNEYINRIPKQYEDYVYHYNENQKTENIVLKNTNENFNNNDHYHDINNTYPSKYETITSSERNNEAMVFKSGLNNKSYLNTNYTSNPYQFEKGIGENEMNVNNEQNGNSNYNPSFHHSMKAYRQYLVTDSNSNNNSNSNNLPIYENINEKNINNIYLPSSQYTTENQYSNYSSQIETTNKTNTLSSHVTQLHGNDMMNIHNNTASYINTNNSSIQLKKRILASEGNLFINMRDQYELDMNKNIDNTELKLDFNCKEKINENFTNSNFNNSTKEYKDISNKCIKNNFIKQEDHYKNLPSDQSSTKDLTNRYKVFKEMKERNKDTNINYNKFLNHNEKEYIPFFKPNIESKTNLINQEVTNDNCQLTKQIDKTNLSINAPVTIPYDSYDNYYHQRQYSSGNPIIINNEKDHHLIDNLIKEEDNHSINNHKSLNCIKNDYTLNNYNNNNNHYTYEFQNLPTNKQITLNPNVTNEVKFNTTNDCNFYLYYGFGSQISKDLSYTKFKNRIDQQKNKKSTLFESTVIHNKTKTCQYSSPTDFYYNTTCSTMPNQISIQSKQKETQNSLNTNESRILDYKRKECIDYQRVFNANKRKTVISPNNKESLHIRRNIKKNFRRNNTQKANKTQFDNKYYVDPNIEYGKLFVNLDELKKEKLQFI